MKQERDTDAPYLQNLGEGQARTGDVELNERFERTLSEVFPDDTGERFSDKWFLRQSLSPYLDEYLILAHDPVTIRELQALLETPLEFPKGIFAGGVFGAECLWADGIRDQQIRSVLQNVGFTRALVVKRTNDG